MRSTKAVPLALTFGALAVMSCAQPAAAPSNSMPESYRQVQASALALQRHALLAMADSMPERLYHNKTTPIQRDFSQQIMHAAGVFPMFGPMLMGGPPAQMPDSIAAHNTRAGLRAYINAAYDYADTLLASQSAASRDSTVDMFGTQLPRWKVWDELHQHTFWTAGQVVANFRTNGMAPPGFGFF